MSEARSTGDHYLADEAATDCMGGCLWRAWAGEFCVVGLSGELGAGKTCLVRGLLRAAGHQGAVGSPTYTLMEPYAIPGGRVLHMDLYRLADPEELEDLGLRDEMLGDTLVVVEWPQQGEGVLPPLDVAIRLAVDGDGRRLQWRAETPTGVRFGHQLAACVQARQTSF